MNGTISAKVRTGGGIDPETGQPIQVSSFWDVPVSCKYKANTLSNRGRYEGGTFKMASYEITTPVMDFQASMIQLFDSRNNLVCEKEVMSLEVLEYVQRVKIIV